MIAGKIIPAIATSTALIVGAIGIELYKYFFNTPFSGTRNFFANLSLSVFSFYEPVGPKI